MSEEWGVCEEEMATLYSTQNMRAEASSVRRQVYRHSFQNSKTSPNPATLTCFSLFIKKNNE